MINDFPLLKLMLADQLKQNTIYKPGDYWEGYCNRIVNAINSNGLDNFRSKSGISKGYADTYPFDPFELISKNNLPHKIHRKIIKNNLFRKYFITPYIKQNESLYNEFKKYRDIHYSNILGDWFKDFSGKHNLPETLYGDPQDVISINGYKVGVSYLRSFLRIDAYSHCVDFSKISSVFEVGGGFGALAHTLMQLYPNIRKYIYLDIPPVLYVGTQYLKYFYSDNVIDYAQTREKDDISFNNSDKREIIALCPWQLDHVNSQIDLFWNSASFQEMPQNIVKNYIQHFDKLKKQKSNFCLVHYRNGTPGKTLKIDKINEIVQSNSSFSVRKIDQIHDMFDENYYLFRA